MSLSLFFDRSVHRRLAFVVAALSGLLFGYDVGIISGAILFVHHSFPLSASAEGLVVSAVSFGALVAAALSGRMNDFLGRRDSLLVTALIFIAGSLVCAWSTSIAVLVTGRFLLGLAVGVGSFSAPLYIAELSSQDSRGRLVTLNQLAITSGILVAYLVNYLLAAGGYWQWMLGLGAVPALFLAAGIGLLPRSPRWLMLKGRQSQAEQSLRLLYDESQVKSEIQSIRENLGDNKRTMSLLAVFKSRYAPVLLLGVLVSILTQAVGINAVIYYAPTIFKAAGFSGSASAILATVGLGVVNVLFTIVAMFCLDRFGRRKMLLGGVTGIILSLLVLTMTFLVGLHAHASVWIAFICLAVFIASQAVGTGPACWLVPSEIFPTQMRSVGMSISVSFNWLTNVVIAFLFPVLLSHSGPVVLFGMFLTIAVIAWIYFYMNVPETKGRSLESISQNIDAGLPLRQLGQPAASSLVDSLASEEVA